MQRVLVNVDVVLLDGKDLNSQPIPSDEQVLDRSQVLPVWQPVRIREADMQPCRLVGVVVFHRCDDSESISKDKRSCDFWWEWERVC